MLKTNYTDFSGENPFIAKEYCKNNIAFKQPFVNYCNENYNISMVSNAGQRDLKQSLLLNNNSQAKNNDKYRKSLLVDLKQKNFKTRTQEIKEEMERNSLIQLEMISDMENSPIRKDCLLSIGAVLLIFIALSLFEWLIAYYTGMLL